MIQFFEDILKNGGLSQLVAYLITITCLGQIYILFFAKRHEILKDLRGQDVRWQFLEISGVLWLLLFPALVLSSIFSDKSYPPEVWLTMDVIYFINILGKRADKFIEAKYGIVSEITKQVVETKTTETVKKNDTTNENSETKESIE